MNISLITSKTETPSRYAVKWGLKLIAHVYQDKPGRWIGNYYGLDNGGLNEIKQVCIEDGKAHCIEAVTNRAQEDLDKREAEDAAWRKSPEGRMDVVKNYLEWTCGGRKAAAEESFNDYAAKYGLASAIARQSGEVLYATHLTALADDLMGKLNEWTDGITDERVEILRKHRGYVADLLIRACQNTGCSTSPSHNMDTDANKRAYAEFAEVMDNLLTALG